MENAQRKREMAKSGKDKKKTTVIVWQSEYWIKASGYTFGHAKEKNIYIVGLVI